MTLATWPATLPALPDLPYQRSRSPGVLVFPTEVGEGKRRRRSARRLWAVDVVFTITQTQLTAFESWFQGSIADGASPFQWVDPADGATTRWLFETGAYKTEALGGPLWKLSMRLTRVS